MNTCKDCNKPISDRRSERCLSCEHNRRRTGKNYNKCLDCGKQLSNYHTKRCRSCFRITRIGVPRSVETKRKISKALKKPPKPKSLGQRKTYSIGDTRKHGKYTYIKIDDIKGSKRNWVALHRFLIEKEIGRSLAPNEHVHHIDGNGHNNNMDNLVLLSASQHSTINHVLTKANADKSGTFLEALLKTIKSRYGVT